MAVILSDPAGDRAVEIRLGRQYDVRRRRFTQQDPIGLAGGLNLYGYAGGDPVNYSDPFGLAPCTDAQKDNGWSDVTSQDGFDECQSERSLPAVRVTAEKPSVEGDRCSATGFLSNVAYGAEVSAAFGGAAGAIAGYYAGAAGGAVIGGTAGTIVGFVAGPAGSVAAGMVGSVGGGLAAGAAGAVAGSVVGVSYGALNGAAGGFLTWMYQCFSGR